MIAPTASIAERARGWSPRGGELENS